MIDLFKSSEKVFHYNKNILTLDNKKNNLQNKCE